MNAYKDKTPPGLFQRNIITAFKRSRLAQSMLTVILFFIAGYLMVSWRNNLLREEQLLAARRRFNSKFSSDDIFKYQAGGVKLPPDNRGLVRYVGNQIAGPSRHSGLNLTAPSKMDYSAHGQSKFVDTLLGGRTDGFYVECGASDGERKSTTLFFEKERNWEGFLIEANPFSYRRLLLKRRKAYSINACLNPTNEAKVMTFKPVGLVGGLEHGMDKQHIEMIHRSPDFSRDVDVQCYPLYSILLALGPMYIDYFSLDIHGMELDILKTIPFDKVTIDVISVEYQILKQDKSVDVKASVEKLNKIRKFFTSTDLYEEKGILPAKAGQIKKDVEANGHDVFFMRKDVEINDDYGDEDIEQI